MKKSFRNLLILVLSLVMVLSFTACVSNCKLGKHTLEDVSAQSATCIQAGNIAYKYCFSCDSYFDANGKVITREQTVVPALGHDMDQGVVTTPATSTAEGIRTYSCQREDCIHTFIEKIDKLDGNQTITEPRYVEFYAVNDFHGATDKLAKLGNYLKEHKDANTIVLSSGDMFQETLESNWNYGSLVNSCMEEMGFDCMTLGNHEFDWGMQKIQELKENTSVKFLGANIYHWDRNSGWGTFADEIAEPYYIRTLANGLKVGVIGVIGSDQITSINANLVQTIGFKDPSEVVPDLSAKLRNEENCDVVVLSIHHGVNSDDRSVGTIDNQALNATQYVDAVFCAHSHKKELEEKDGVPFIQGGGNGSYISNVRLEVDKDGQVKCIKSQNISYNSSWVEDSTIAMMVKQSNDYITAIANEVLVTVNGYFNNQGSYGFPRLACKAIAQFAKKQGYDIDIAMMNQARSRVNGGAVTYTELFHALPFDNIVYIAEVSGSDLLGQSGYGNFWRVTSEPITSEGTYTIAVIDYVFVPPRQ